MRMTPKHAEEFNKGIWFKLIVEETTNNPDDNVDKFDLPQEFTFEFSSQEQVASQMQTILPGFEIASGSYYILTTSQYDFKSHDKLIVDGNECYIIETKFMPLNDIRSLRGIKVDKVRYIITS
jgi:hypothetical protein